MSIPYMENFNKVMELSSKMYFTVTFFGQQLWKIILS